MRKPSNQVLYLSYDGLTDPLGQSQILPYLAGLSALGYIITIISFEKPDRLKTSSQMIRQYCIENNLLWEPLIYHKSPAVVSTLYDLMALRRKTRKLCQEGNYSMVHCRSYITAIIGLWLKNKYRVRFIFDMRGFWADERVEGGLWNLKNPLYELVYHYFKKKEREFLTGADHIISLTENAKQEILSWSITNAPITVIPTCVDLNLFNPAKVNKEKQDALRIELGIHKEDFVLIYLGSWGTWYLTEEMLTFFSELKKQKRSAKFLILSPDKIELENYPDKIDLILTSAPRHLIPLYISLANASVFFIKATFSKKASSATKMGEIMAMGTPFVTNSGWGDVEQIVKQESSTFMVHEFNKQEYRSVILALLKAPVIKGRQIDKDHPLSLSFGVLAYERVWKGLRSFPPEH